MWSDLLSSSPRSLGPARPNSGCSPASSGLIIVSRDGAQLLRTLLLSQVSRTAQPPPLTVLLSSMPGRGQLQGQQGWAASGSPTHTHRNTADDSAFCSILTNGYSHSYSLSLQLSKRDTDECGGMVLIFNTDCTKVDKKIPALDSA